MRVSRYGTLSLLCAALLLAEAPRAQAQAEGGPLDSALERAQAEQSTGQYARAAADYACAVALDPAQPELWANRGVMEYLSGQTAPSIVSLKRALSLNSTLVTPMVFLGKDYVQTGKPQLALPYLKRAHALHPEDAEILFTLGKAQQALQQPESAASAFAEAARLAPTNSGAWFGLGVASMAIIAKHGRELADTQAHSVWARALYADELFAQGRPAEALDTYNTLAAGASPAQLATLAQVLRQMRDHPDIFALPPASQQPLRTLSETLTAKTGAGAQQRCDPVSAAAQAAHAVQPLQRAACSYWAGDYQTSTAASAQALAQSPGNAEALYWSIKSNERRAVAALTRFEDLAPQSAATYDLIGDLYRRQRQPDSALAAYRKALAIDAHDAPAQLGAAAVFLSEGDADKTISLAQAALADRPGDIQLNLLVAEALVDKHQFSDALPYLEQCANAPPDLAPRVHALLGRVYADLGRFSQAISQLLLALPIDQDGSLHFQIARLYRKTGHPAEARKADADAQILIHKRMANAAVALHETSTAQP